MPTKNMFAFCQARNPVPKNIEPVKILDHSLMFPDQTNNRVTYFRHLNVLNVSLNSKSDAKVILNIYVPL